MISPRGGVSSARVARPRVRAIEVVELRTGPRSASESHSSDAVEAAAGPGPGPAVTGATTRHQDAASGRPQMGESLPIPRASDGHPTRHTLSSMGDWTLRVLLIRRFAAVDDTFEYRGERLPEVGYDIELRDAAKGVVYAKVTGIEPTKSLPIRAAEIQR
jgi:hypothetical protein